MTPCPRSGCGGTVADDGFCDTCWLAPPAAAPPVAPSPVAAARPAGRPPEAVRTTSTVPSTTPSRRAGTGLVELPDIAVADPAAAVLVDPSVPEHRRCCSVCNQPVGRTRHGEPGRLRGFCASCGAPFDFAPRLAAGELVAGQYEVAGCLAHGGMGWVYLAVDLKVERQWVVLKGLLDQGDHDAMAAALSERRFLAEVRHPNIVRILNFVEHGGDGYIVMEYVEGTSLRDERRSNGHSQPLTLEHAIAFVLELLPALGHLHARGLVYCDLKPDNVIHTPRSAGVNVKLIDLGGVRRVDDSAGPVFGTIGYQAPEIAVTGPSVATDVFTVGRLLAVLCADIPTYQSIHRYALPEPSELAVLGEHDSLYRFLIRSTAADPDRRFGSAEEMGDQLTGVLREIVAARTGVPNPGVSTQFSVPGRAALDRPRWDSLPRPTIDPDDVGAGSILATSQLDPAEVVRVLDATGFDTPEVALWAARMSIAGGDLDGARQRLARRTDAGWRLDWYRGLIALAAGEDATSSFDAVLSELPGELAPKLALAFAAELAADHVIAASWYDVVATTDDRYPVASFGLARCRLALGDRARAVDALGRVPETSSAFVEAAAATVDALLVGVDGGCVGSDVARAASVVAQIDPGEPRREPLEATVYAAALDLLLAGRLDPATMPEVLGVATVERDVRLRLEQTFRSMARRAPDRATRIALVDRANTIRPRSLL